MMSNKVCPVCGCGNHSVINTYKHYWYSCNDCGNILRERKGKYFISFLFPETIARKFLPGFLANMMYPIQDVIENEKTFYDYYASVSAKGLVGTKWFDQIQSIKNWLEFYGIPIDNKKILDISGGPGFVGAELSKTASRVVVTEFSQTAVDGMNKNLGIEAVKFDYQNDRIDQVVSGKFDIIFINYSINFCLDLKLFVHSLRELSHKDTVVYISFVPPHAWMLPEVAA